MTHLRRFAPTAPAEWPWNGWPNAGGIAGRMLVEQVAEWRGMRTLTEGLADLLHRRVDLVPEHELNRHIRDRVLSEAIDL